MDSESPYDLLKYTHIACVIASGALFSLRGALAIAESAALQHTAFRILPHAVDTLLLASAIGMLTIAGINPFAVAFLSAKIIALFIYIGLGLVTMRFARTKRARTIAYVGALATFAYIVATALLKVPFLGV